MSRKIPGVRERHYPLINASAEKFASAAAAVLRRLEAGSRVLVHCYAGADRSPKVCAIVVALINGCSWKQAKRYVEAGRSSWRDAPKNERAAREALEILRPETG